MVSLESGIPSVYARNILLSCGKIEYKEPIYLPDYNKSSFQINEDSEYTIKNDVTNQSLL